MDQYSNSHSFREPLPETYSEKRFYGHRLLLVGIAGASMLGAAYVKGITAHAEGIGCPPQTVGEANPKPKTLTDQIKTKLDQKPRCVTAAAQERIADKNPDPLFRAASVTLTSFRYPNSMVVGSGGLIEHEGELYISTIAHVNESMRRHMQGTPRWAHIPSVGPIELTVPTQSMYVHDNIVKKGDPPELLPIDEDWKPFVQAKINEGEITPLKLGELERVPGQKYLIANPDTGSYTAITYSGQEKIRVFNEITGAWINDKQDVFALADTGDQVAGWLMTILMGGNQTNRVDPDWVVQQGVCKGDSGLPIVMAESPQTVVATLSVIRGTTGIDGADRPFCGVTIFGRTAL